MSKPAVLLDMDNTLVDFDGQLIQQFHQRHGIDVEHLIRIRPQYAVEDILTAGYSEVSA